MMKGILFDFNGTLFFDSKMHIEAFRRVMPLYGLPIPTPEFLIGQVFGATNAHIVRTHINKDATDAECARFSDMKVHKYFDICLETPERLHLVDGVPEMLGELKARRIPYAIVTGSDREELDFFIEHLGLDRWFDRSNIVYNDGSFSGKPAPDCYLRGAEILGLSPSECLVFEDGTSGIRAATAAGVGAIVANYEQGIPDPVADGLAVAATTHDFTNWRETLSRFGLL